MHTSSLHPLPLRRCHEPSLAGGGSTRSPARRRLRERTALLVRTASPQAQGDTELKRRCYRRMARLAPARAPPWLFVRFIHAAKSLMMRRSETKFARFVHVRYAARVVCAGVGVTRRVVRSYLEELGAVPAGMRVWRMDKMMSEYKQLAERGSGERRLSWGARGRRTQE